MNSFFSIGWPRAAEYYCVCGCSTGAHGDSAKIDAQHKQQYSLLSFFSRAVHCSTSW